MHSNEISNDSLEIIYKENEVIFTLQRFENLYINYLIPSAIRFRNELKNDFKLSKYSDQADLNISFFDESLREVTQAGLTSLYHKIENFVNWIDTHSQGNNLRPFSELLMQHELTKKNLYKTNPYNTPVNQLRIIANSIKHNGGILTDAEIKILEPLECIEIQDNTFKADHYTLIYFTRSIILYASVINILRISLELRSSLHISLEKCISNEQRQVIISNISETDKSIDSIIITLNSIDKSDFISNARRSHKIISKSVDLLTKITN